MPCSLARAGLAFAASVALIAGCAHSDMKTPIGRATVTVLPALTADQTRGLVSVPWSVTDLGGSADTLFLRVPAAGCPRPRGALITESPADVTIQIYATTMPDCSDAPIGFVVAPVHLTAPLGTRHLLHGPAVSSAPSRFQRAQPFPARPAVSSAPSPFQGARRGRSGEPGKGGTSGPGPFRPGGGR